MRSLLLSLLFLLLLNGAFAADTSLGDKKKAIRMKATSKLKEILKELKIKFNPEMDKDAIHALVLKEDALTRWEKLHPEQKKKPRSQTSAGFGGAGGGSEDDQMSAMFFTLLDDDKDGRLSKKEMEALGKLAPEGAQAGAPPPDQLFQMTDADRDGYVTKEEMAVFTRHMQSMGGGGGGMPGMGGGMPGMMGGGMSGMMGGGMPGMGGGMPGGMMGGGMPPGMMGGGGPGMGDDDGRDEL